MISQVVCVDDNWDTAAGTINGLVQLAVALWLWWSVAHAYPRLRPWRAALAGWWTTLAVVLLAAPLGLMPPTWTLWIVHGMLIALGPGMMFSFHSANRVAHKIEADLNDSMKDSK